ncbi:LPS-assembly protein LptD [Rhizobiaceae bacterium]|nr:LPS-assembly protein LptD [Rhizobiaceae bacterium]
MTIPCPSVGTISEKSVKNARALVLLAGTALALATVPTPTLNSAHAQTLQQNDPDAQLLLRADRLSFDNDAKVVTAFGNVQMDYDGYNVVAERVSYNQTTRRVKAFGKVEIVEPNGNRIYAEEIDITDDFADGFVNALRVETPENTRFAAQSAERRPGDLTVFNNGVYTACEPCREKPDRAPIWQIKAQTVVLDGVEKTVTYRDASFEFFGVPIAYVPFFRHADPSVKRKRGFLSPRMGQTDELGFWYKQNYFIPIGDTADVTVGGGYYTEQGALIEGRYRQQLENGTFSVFAAGISQQNPDNFDSGPDNDVTERGMVATTGRFDINPRWDVSWSWLAQSDSNFARTYEIQGWDAANITNTVALTGLAGRNYFKASINRYIVQSSTIVSTGDDDDAFFAQDQQATLLPLVDYNYETTDGPLAGLTTFDVNLQAIDRQRENTLTGANDEDILFGIEGQSARLTAEVGFKRTLDTSVGLRLTPELSLRGDALAADRGTVRATDTASFEPQDGFRGMATAGMTASYPLLVRTENTSHVFEPIAQIYARPNIIGQDSMFVNEDSQSLVFGASNLFSRDKFSGYDRIETGTRANVGLRYSAGFASGLTLGAVVGQSYHLAGDNPYSVLDDPTNAGQDSGLQEDVSDYVASLSLNTGRGITFDAQARVTKDDLDLARTTLAASLVRGPVTADLTYTYIAAQPAYRFEDDREQVTARGTYNFRENWTVGAGVQYDIDLAYVVNDYVGLTYSDECFLYSLNFKQAHTEEGLTSRAITFNIGLRTLGDFGYTYKVSAADDIADDDLFPSSFSNF